VALIGIERRSDENDRRRAAADAVRDDLCAALFGMDQPDGVVPVAYFSDFRCPYCRVLERDLDTLFAEDPALRLVQHELPIFGPPSEFAARASVAAVRQGGQQELRRRFMRTPLALLRQIVEDEKALPPLRC